MMKSPKYPFFLRASIYFQLAFSSICFSEFAILIPERSAVYQQIADTIRADTPGIASRVITIDELETKKDAFEFELIVSIGREAFTAIPRSDTHIPVISGFVTGIKRDSIKHNQTVIFNDINIALSVQLIRSLYDQKDVNIGIFYSGNTYFINDEVNKLNDKGINITAIQIHAGDNPVKKVKELIKLKKIRSFILIPDSDIYTSNAMHVMLYTLFQHKVSAIAYSSNLVVNGAGGAAATYFNRSIITKTISSTINDFYKHNKLTSRWVIPSQALITLNSRLARSLNLNTADYNEGGAINEK